MRRVCVVVGSRANYSSIKAGMRAIRSHPDLELQLIVGASAVLDRYGSVVDVIERDGFVPDARINIIVEGETPATMAKSTGLGLLEIPTLFELFKPDVVVSVGDRFETMAPVVAAAYMNIPVAHIQGGEVTGSIDESIRHAMSKFAHIQKLSGGSFYWIDETCCLSRRKLQCFYSRRCLSGYPGSEYWFATDGT